jgi:hypothetical protein
MQLILGATFLAAPYIAPENIAPESIHFGSWSLCRYTEEQRERWLNRAARTELEGMAALAVVVCGLIIYGYVGKFCEVAGKAETGTE